MGEQPRKFDLGAEWESGAESAWKPSWNTICGRSIGGVDYQVYEYQTRTMYSVLNMGVLTPVVLRRTPCIQPIITCINVNVFSRIRV